jgi:hypothetical protein
MRIWAFLHDFIIELAYLIRPSSLKFTLKLRFQIDQSDSLEICAKHEGLFTKKIGMEDKKLVESVTVWFQS